MVTPRGAAATPLDHPSLEPGLKTLSFQTPFLGEDKTKQKKPLRSRQRSLLSWELLFLWQGKSDAAGGACLGAPASSLGSETWQAESQGNVLAALPKHPWAGVVGFNP